MKKIALGFVFLMLFAAVQALEDSGQTNPLEAPPIYDEIEADLNFEKGKSITSEAVGELMAMLFYGVIGCFVLSIAALLYMELLRQKKWGL